MTRVIRRLSGVQVHVPSPSDTAAFLAGCLDFRHRTGEADGVEHVATDGSYGLTAPACELTLVPGEQVGVAAVVFEVTAEDGLSRIAGRLEQLGIASTALDEDVTGGPGIGFQQPDGVPIECRVANAREDAVPGEPSDVRPRRLGHVNLKMPSPPRAHEFFSDVLGLRLTEQLGEMLYFLRVNADHHNLAFRPGDHATVHHVAFELSGWDHVRVICDHLAARGHHIEYGPGRHGPGHQLFVYVLDPSSNLRLELFADMAQIDDDEAYTPIRRDIARFSSLNVWGPAPPDSFLE